ncbi:hypothetical protein [Leeia aquatica]|uniref:DUF86 domain-containing protein n=1 Tax=Leeia aquatica TaxID=2725557 RepID=A0A847SBJ7_9NEIS|nr:hypothetical protein [Leeia aquatica]NLR74896.1 hypothetical protein [Leeia aquatica]
MEIMNPEIDYAAECDSLRAAYVRAHPQQRLKVIMQRIAQQEIGATRLVTMVSAVEALARSLVVNSVAAKTNQKLDIEGAYKKFRNGKPEDMVRMVLEHYDKGDPGLFFQGDTWDLFRLAVDFRNLIVHECTFLGQDKYPALIWACEEVLNALKEVAGLKS